MTTGAKYIFVTEGQSRTHMGCLVAASTARLLLARGYCATVIKLETTLNIDHSGGNGEHFVCGDGYEASADMAVCERIAGIKTSRANNMGLGRIYQNVIDNERRGNYRGEEVTVVPHVTDEIKRNITSLGARHEFVIVEIDGAIDDIATAPYLEAMRQMQDEQHERCLHITLTDDGLMLGSTRLKCEKDYGYDTPLVLRDLGLDRLILENTDTPIMGDARLEELERIFDNDRPCKMAITIGLVGLPTIDYPSISDMVHLASLHTDGRGSTHHIDCLALNDGNVEQEIAMCDGIIIAPGDGQRGCEGKMTALKYCREHDIPTLAIGQGMHCMVVEVARNVLGIAGANSTEVDPDTDYNVIDPMDEAKRLAHLGETNRYGDFNCHLEAGTQVASLYNKQLVTERHRHRYELNNEYRDALQEAGMTIAGTNPETQLVEVVEMRGKCFYVGTQYSPEYGATAHEPHPLFVELARQAWRRAEQRRQE